MGPSHRNATPCALQVLLYILAYLVLRRASEMGIMVCTFRCQEPNPGPSPAEPMPVKWTGEYKSDLFNVLVFSWFISFSFTFFFFK